MKMVKFIGLASILLLILSGCRKDEIIDTTTTDKDQPQLIINSSVSVLVSDETGNPVEDVYVALGSTNGKTNEIGVATFKNVKMNEAGQLLELSHPDFYELQKVFYPRLNTSLTVDVKMMKKEVAGLISSTEGGTVTTTKGAKVIFPANGFVIESIDQSINKSYDGNVRVYARWMDPTDRNLDQIMPGNLRAINREGGSVQLVSYGMMAVELEGENGEKLQIKEGHQATLDFPLPAETAANAPTTIPLWYYNTDNGNWIEESVAELINGRYIGNVNHFSFWNCDAPFDLVNFMARLVNDAGEPIQGIKTSIEITSTGNTGYGNSDSEGYITGKIPSNQQLKLVIYNICNEIGGSIDLGPYSDDIDYGDINIIQYMQDSYQTTIQGRLLNCDGDPVTDGGLYLRGTNYLNGYAEVDENGNFETSFLICESVNLKGHAYDNETNKGKENIDISITTDNLAIDMGDINVCNELENGIWIESEYKPDGINSFSDYFKIQECSGGLNGGLDGGLLTIYAQQSTMDSINFYINAKILEGGSEGLVTYLNYELYKPDTNESLSISTSQNNDCPINIEELIPPQEQGQPGSLNCIIECDFIHVSTDMNTPTAYPGKIIIKGVPLY